MKLTEENSRFAVIKTAFHGGGTISFHRSLHAALRARDAFQSKGTCSCGCAGVVPVTKEAREYAKFMIDTCRGDSPLYAEYPTLDATQRSPYELCR